MSARACIGLAVSALAASACLLAMAAPLLEARGRAGEAFLLRMVFDPVCHQIADRSIRVAGSPMAVCARCAGLYLGGLTGCLALTALALGRRGSVAPPRRRVLFAAAIPTALELLLELSGPLKGTSSTAAAARALTGWLLGVAVTFYLLPALEEMRAEIVAEFRRLRPPMETTHAESS